MSWRLGQGQKEGTKGSGRGKGTEGLRENLRQGRAWEGSMKKETTYSEEKEHRMGGVRESRVGKETGPGGVSGISCVRERLGS